MRSYTSIKRGLPEKIFELRNKGLSYGKIAKQLGCAKSTVCYYLGKDQKEKIKARKRKYKLGLPRLPEGYLNDVTQVTQS